MDLPSGAVQQRLIRDLLGEDVLEGIGLFWDKAGLVEEFGSLQVPETASEDVLGYLRDSLQKGDRNLRPDHGCRLQEVLLRRREPVDTRCEHRLDRVRYGHGRLAAPSLIHRPGQLLQEEGIPTRFGHNGLRQMVWHGCICATDWTTVRLSCGRSRGRATWVKTDCSSQGGR